MGVPMLLDGEVVGVLIVWRTQVDPFSERATELLTTFATQAAIAIRSVDLVNALKARSAEVEVASRHKSEFLASMSHELRTPLNAVIGFSEVLLERMFGDLNDRQEEYLRDIWSSGKHLLELLNEILDLSKVEAGQMDAGAGRVLPPGGPRPRPRPGARARRPARHPARPRGRRPTSGRCAPTSCGSSR